MRAILLAAGMGTRLRPLTLDTPKSLIEVNKKPLLERQVEFLKEKGIDEIILCDQLITDAEQEKENYGGRACAMRRARCVWLHFRKTSARGV